MTENLPTELPILPEGQRWHVIKDVDEDYIPSRLYYQVRLERKKWWGWSWIDRTEIDSLTEGDIVKGAHYIAARQAQREQRLKTEDKYLGAYPPKRLG